MMDVLCLLHVVYYNRYMGDYMVPYHELYAPIVIGLVLPFSLKIRRVLIPAHTFAKQRGLYERDWGLAHRHLVPILLDPFFFPVSKRVFQERNSREKPTASSLTISSTAQQAIVKYLSKSKSLICKGQYSPSSADIKYLDTLYI